jgi:hypothetical protein
MDPFLEARDELLLGYGPIVGLAATAAEHVIVAAT